MEHIKSIIDNSKQPEKITRFVYSPYKMEIAKRMWFDILKDFEPEIKPGKQQSIIWSNLIKYIHGDDTCPYDLKKGVFIAGGTGSGKTLTMRVMNNYIGIDDVKYKRGNKIIPFHYRIVSAREIASDYQSKGIDGIEKYKITGNLCIDDLGTETEDIKYYGTSLDVLSEIIEVRYSKGLLTHFTCNLPDEKLNERYNSRVYSRIKHQCTIITMNDKDFRLSEAY